MLKVGLTTLGCKVNQCDSAALAENLQSAGFSLVPFNAFADAYVINTCTVTAFADFPGAPAHPQGAQKKSPRPRDRDRLLPADTAPDTG